MQQVDSGRGGPPSLGILCGARWAGEYGVGGQASWPLVKAEFTRSGVGIGPSVALLRLFIPQWSITWAEVSMMENATWGVRIVSGGRPLLVLLTWPHRSNNRAILEFAKENGARVNEGGAPVRWTGV